MMREIKFREWDQAREDMIPGHGMSYSVRKDSDDEVSFVFAHYESDESWEHDHRVLEQYTGLDDINGKPVYEGDIVQVYRDWIDVVEFHNGSFGLAASMNHSFILFNNLYGEAEVIGNIHNNPELLEDKK